MAAVRPEDALRRAKDLRKQANEARTETLKRSLNGAADRLERNAARQANKIGKPVRRR